MAKSKRSLKRRRVISKRPKKLSETKEFTKKKRFQEFLQADLLRMRNEKALTVLEEQAPSIIKEIQDEEE